MNLAMPLQFGIRYGPRLTELLLVLAMAWLVSGMLLPKSDLSAPSVEQQDQSSAEAFELGRIEPLFGHLEKEKAASKPVAETPKPVRISRLNARLLGTVVAGKHSAAVMKLDGEKEQKVFFIGDVIRPGITLKRVEADAVIIDRGGAEERVQMENGEAVAPGNPGPSPVSSPFPRRSRLQGFARSQIQNQLRDFPKLLSEARVVPHFIDGKADGFVISDIVPGSLYEQAGLQNGDIIRRVNGQQVTSAEQAMAMYQALQNAPTIDVEIVRAGQVQQIHYQIR